MNTVNLQIFNQRYVISRNSDTKLMQKFVIFENFVTIIVS